MIAPRPAAALDGVDDEAKRKVRGENAAERLFRRAVPGSRA